MPSSFITGCTECPYYNQKHLQNTAYFVARNTPLSAEINLPKNSRDKTLLVFQAPGVDEWINNEPISSKKSHSCAMRMTNSFMRKGVTKSNYDITEAVQCFPGKNTNERDKKPCRPERSSCLQYLEQDIEKGNYSTIVCFGKIAQDSVSKAISNIKACNPTFNVPNIKSAPHPSGRVSNSVLDNSY